MPNKKKKQSSKFELTPEALQELDKSTLVSLLVKMHEQYQQLSEAMQIFMREKNGPKTERFVDPDQLNLFQENASAPSSSDTTLQDSHTEKSATNEDAQKLSTKKEI